MAENSKIEWTDHTFNPWMGCTKVSPGCDHCYAEALMDTRYGKVQWGPHGERVRTAPANWRKPRQWAKAARESGARPRVFCASLADVFDNQVPVQWRSDLFDLIASTPELDWLLLTKRPQNVGRMMPAGEWLNVWLGTTCCDRSEYERNWDALRHANAAVHFISYEPALGPLTMFPFPHRLAGDEPGKLLPDWIICGGESGHGAREMDAEWSRALLKECAWHNVAFFMKQMTGKKPIPDDLLVRQFPRGSAMIGEDRQ